MKKISVAIVCLLLCVLSSCNGDGISNNAEMSSNLILTPSSGYRYIYRTDCTSGLLHKKDSFLWYYDYESGVDIPLCSDPSCSHNSRSCYSYFPTWTFTCNNKFFLYSGEDDWSETEGFIYHTTIIAADLGEQTRREVLRIDYETTHAYAYGDKLFFICREGYYLDSDYLGANPNRGRVYLMEISLDTMEILYQSECLADGYFADAELWGVFEDELYFMIYSYDDSDNDENNDLLAQQPANKYVKYDLSTHEIVDNSDHEKFTFIVSDDCMINYGNGITSFVTPEKNCELTSEVITSMTPILPLLEMNDEVYFTVYGNDSSIFRYDLAKEMLYEAEYDELKNNTLAAVTTNGYVFVTENEEVYTLNKEDMLFFKIDSNRYNEVCENWNAAVENE